MFSATLWSAAGPISLPLACVYARRKHVNSLEHVYCAWIHCHFVGTELFFLWSSTEPGSHLSDPTKCEQISWFKHDEWEIGFVCNKTYKWLHVKDVHFTLEGEFWLLGAVLLGASRGENSDVLFLGSLAANRCSQDQLNTQRAELSDYFAKRCRRLCLVRLNGEQLCFQVLGRRALRW